jgi:hypothetical protein
MMPGSFKLGSVAIDIRSTTLAVRGCYRPVLAVAITRKWFFEPAPIGFCFISALPPLLQFWFTNGALLAARLAYVESITLFIFGGVSISPGKHRPRRRV